MIGAAADEGAKRVLSTLRLKTTLTVFIVCLLLAVSGLTFLLVTQIFNQFNGAVREDLAWKAARGAREIAEAAESAVAIADENGILHSIGDYRRTADVESVVVVDMAGRTLATHGQPPRPVSEFFSGPEGAVQAAPGYVWAWSWSSIEETPVGRVALIISLDRLDAGERLRRRLLLLSGAGCVVAFAISLFFVSFYLGPVLRFAEKTLKELKELNATLEERVVERTTELSDANGRLQESLKEIRSMQRALVDTSRRAGMADVATAVLHNVGNVLNSVNVSAGVVVDAVSQSRLTGLDKAVDLMKSHETDLGAFFTTDAKGKRLPAYLAALSEAAREERAVVVRELESLQKNIDHIKVVVARQQMHAKSTLGFVEAVAARSLLDDALAFNGDSMKRHGVQVVCQVEEIPPVNVDRHKAFEILMNLISNAIQAMKMVEGKRELTLRLEARPDDRFAIVVKDTGCGIAPENLKKVFSHGFTTKREGHGFGLHSSALSAAQMGGVLLAESDGPGQGARFTLELPMSARSSSDVDASDDAA